MSYRQEESNDMARQVIAVTGRPPHKLSTLLSANAECWHVRLIFISRQPFLSSSVAIAAAAQEVQQQHGFRDRCALSTCHYRVAIDFQAIYLHTRHFFDQLPSAINT